MFPVEIKQRERGLGERMKQSRMRHYTGRHKEQKKVNFLEKETGIIIKPEILRS